MGQMSNRDMKIASGIKSKFPVLLVAGFGGLLAVVNRTPAQGWQPSALVTEGLRTVAASADSTKLVTTGSGHNYYSGGTIPLPIYTSGDSGASGCKPARRATIGRQLLRRRMALNLSATGYGPIYTSTNSGATWTETAAPTNSWLSVASSADGTKLVAASGRIYTWTNSGANLDTDKRADRFLVIRRLVGGWH